MARYYLDRSVDYGLTSNYQRVNLVHNDDYTWIDILGQDHALLTKVLIEQNGKFIKCLVPTHYIHVKFDNIDELKDGRFNTISYKFYVSLLSKKLHQLKYPYKVSLIKQYREHSLRMDLYVYINDSKDGYLIEGEMIKLCIKLDKVVGSFSYVFIVRGNDINDTSNDILNYSPS